MPPKPQMESALLALMSEMRVQITGQQRQLNALDTYVNSELSKLWSSVGGVAGSGVPLDASVAGSGVAAAKQAP